MTPETPVLLQILKEACEEFGYEWNLVDTYSNNLVEVSNGKKSFFSSNGKTGAYPLNARFSAQLVNDKAWSNKILKQKGYNVPKGDYFFLRDEYLELRGEGKELGDAVKFANELGYPVFIKPNSSSLGILAEVIYSEEELKKHLIEISEISHIAIIQEVIESPEYRIFALDGEIQFAYERVSPKIVGDGKTLISAYLDQLNNQIKRERNKINKESPFLIKQLQKLNMTNDSILKKGQQLQITSKANISAGGEIKNYNESFSEETRNWVRKICNNLSLRVCGIDLFVGDSIENPESFIIIEINQNPNLTGIYELGYKEKVLAIWREILDKYFHEF